MTCRKRVATLLFLLLCSFAAAEDRGMGVVAVGGQDLTIGRHHLLAIGIDKYLDEDLELKTAANGARALQRVLTENYSFAKDDTRLLLDAQATRGGIIAALRDLAEKVGKQDSILIYYAGHGNLDRLTKAGSWIPVDGTFKDAGTWIGNEEIKKLIGAMKAQHVLLISDSCFAGDFFRGQAQVLSQISDASVRRSFEKMSRRAMTAGGVEPVADGGREGHSVYTWWLLKTLQDAGDAYVLPEQLYDRLKGAVGANAAQKPMYGILHGAGGEPDGSFVFFRRGTNTVDAAMRQKLARIKALEKLDKEAAARALRQQQEIASKQRQMAALDARLAKLQQGLGVGGGETDLDAILELGRELKRQAEELARLRKKAEADLKRKEAELAEARRLQDEARRQRFEADYAKYQEVAANKYLNAELKARAWQALLKNWGLPASTPAKKGLFYADGKVQIGDGISVAAAGKEMVIPDLGLALVPIKAGSFMMGDAPGHKVTLTKAYWLGKYEVTQGEYEKLMGKNPSKFKGVKLPVDTVSWTDALAFCAKLTDRERKAGRLPAGYEYRLPTEAEWEYACRAGAGTAYSFGDAADKLGDYAWYGENSGRTTHDVGGKKANAWGLYDMHGNVWEWCLDWYGAYTAGPATDPVGPRTGSGRVDRGGGWFIIASFCRAASRFRFAPALAFNGLGFRVALAPAVQR